MEHISHRRRETPLFIIASNAELALGQLFSGIGYVVAMPDYIGYGSTKNIKHPYGAYKLIAATGIEMFTL